MQAFPSLSPRTEEKEKKCNINCLYSMELENNPSEHVKSYQPASYISYYWCNISGMAKSWLLEPFQRHYQPWCNQNMTAHITWTALLAHHAKTKNECWETFWEQMQLSKLGEWCPSKLWSSQPFLPQLLPQQPLWPDFQAVRLDHTLGRLVEDWKKTPQRTLSASHMRNFLPLPDHSVL